eukprot:CAMPEP_0183708854 /NCGR_PEP_ID=MMETSP0737-20130205/5038_1 /TAXON_ID=385413 /ORGANISM="Thalassiosira miniscula, Strain CCMP1093" /LENGTH=175 /DNA_ID=CAMNT_0025936805 /DNA_START=80 /DNA_END=607 /DNA_ORIENTATION=+
MTKVEVLPCAPEISDHISLPTSHAAVRNRMLRRDNAITILLNGGRNLVVVRGMGLDEIKGTLGTSSGLATHAIVGRGALEINVLKVGKVGLEERIPRAGRVTGFHALLHLINMVVEPEEALVMVRFDVESKSILLFNDSAVMGATLVKKFTAANKTTAPIITKCNGTSLAKRFKV